MKERRADGVGSVNLRCAMTRKQDRYADKAANQTRIHGQTITAGWNVREFIEKYGTHERPAAHLRAVAHHASQWREKGKPQLVSGKGSGPAVIRAEGN